MSANENAYYREQFRKLIGAFLEKISADRLDALALLYLGKYDDLLPEKSSFSESLWLQGLKESAKTPGYENLFKEVVAEFMFKQSSTAGTFEAQMKELFEKIDGVIKRLEEDVDGIINKLKENVDRVNNRLEETEKSSQPVSAKPIYLFVTVLCLITTILFVGYGLVERPQVHIQIQWQLGSIIEGIAVGTAALLAAVTYARKKQGGKYVKSSDQE